MTWLVTRQISRACVILALLVPSAHAMTLTEALQRSLKVDPTVPLSLATFDAERELGSQVSGTLRPSIGIDANAFQQEQRIESDFFAAGGELEEDYPSYGVGITARQPIFRWDWSARREHAKALDTIADLGMRDRTLQIFTRIASRYFGVLVAQDELRLAEAEAKAIRESLEDTRKRYEVEIVPGTDLREAQARDDLAEARLIAARQNLASAQDTLDESTGNGRVRLPALPPDAQLPPLQPADMESWVAKARSANPAILLAQQNVAVARSSHAAVRAEQRPTVDAVAALRRDDSSESQIGSLNDGGKIGVELTVPLYSGVTSAREREAAARLRAAEADSARVRAETERQTRQVFRQLDAAHAQVKAFGVAVKSATTAETATRHGYDAGTRTITDVLNARSATISAQRDFSRTRYDLLLTWLHLKQLAGDLSEKDFAHIDQLLKPSAAVQEKASP